MPALLHVESVHSFKAGPAIATLLFAVATAVGASSCTNPEFVPADERRAIADTLRALVSDAYDFAKPDAPSALLTLYPDSGRVISAAAGRVTTTREALQAEIAGFWQRVGQNMSEPKFEMGSVYVDVVSRNAAVMTFTYRIAHRTPAGAAHSIGGAWTALWRRQGERWTIVQEHLSDAPDVLAPAPATPLATDTAAAAVHRH